MSPRLVNPRVCCLNPVIGQNWVFLTKRKNSVELIFPLSDVTETNCTSQKFSKFPQNAKNFEIKTTKEIS